MGTGRIIWSLNFSERDFAAVLERWVQAGHAMQQAGWWWTDGRTSNKSIKRSLLKESLQRCFQR